jgi:hypothetical protein
LIWGAFEVVFILFVMSRILWIESVVLLCQFWLQ